ALLRGVGQAARAERGRGPAHALERSLGARRREVGHADQMHAGRAPDLRQVHRAELAGADQADANRGAFSGAFLEHAVQVQLLSPLGDDVRADLWGMPALSGPGAAAPLRGASLVFLVRGGSGTNSRFLRNRSCMDAPG